MYLLNRKKQKKIAFVTAIMLAASCMGGCEKKSSLEVSQYGTEVNDMQIPDNVSLIALGEATHGNVEFQELKLEVFKHLVETTDVRAFALESDFGGGVMVNKYISGGEGTAREAVAHLGFYLYQTDQMEELLQWMHDYNQSAEPEDQVRFYGIDMQRDMDSLELLQAYYEKVGTEVEKEAISSLEGYYGTEEDSFQKEDTTDMKKNLELLIADLAANETEYTQVTGEEDFAYAKRAAECMTYNIELFLSTNDYSEIRDRHMYENVEWIKEREETLHQAKVLVSGHNGHVAKIVNSSYTNTGYYLHEKYGDAYYVIGTDFYETECNLPTDTGRENHEFCSDDPVAQAFAEKGNGKYYLDFAKVPQNTNLYTTIHEKMKTGSLGESYSPLMKMSKNMYQVNLVPTELYDSMIFVPKATPTVLWERE